MKKLLLASVAISGLAFAAPAQAEVELELGGYFLGYGAFTNQDETTDNDVNAFDIIRETEIHFGGETTLDNGLTVGAHIEFDVDAADNGAMVEEGYVYFSGDWGRVNFGQEDGAGYLLQVAAPSADSMVDGIVQTIGSFADATNFDPTPTSGLLDYDMRDTAEDDKITYLSPVMSGFQFGVSYTPSLDPAAQYSVGVDDQTTTDDDDAYEIAVRYEGEFENVGVIAGAGYSIVNEVSSSATTDDQKIWNIGLDLDVAAFGIGAVYMEDNNGEAGSGANEGDNEVLVIGADYTTGPFKLGLSYYNNEDKATNGVEYDRWTAGVVYDYGPGMSFRGSIQMLDQDNPTGTADTDGTAVLLGTFISF